MLDLDELNEIRAEVLLGKPRTVHGPEADAMRKSLRKDHIIMKKYGIMPAAVNDIGGKKP
jgi:hypothetical protein